MTDLADILIQGFLVGGLYALLALGFVMVVKSSQILNLAYGYQILITAYILFWLLDGLGLPLGVAVPVIFLVGAFMGFTIERLAIRPLLGQPFLAILMTTLMLGTLIKGIAVMIWAGASYSFPFTPGGMLNIGGIQILPSVLYAFVTALVIFGLMYVLFQKTKVGLAMRVVAADNTVAQSLGITVKKIFSVSWVVSGVIASVCAMLAGMVQMVTPELGDIALMKGLPVLLLGGMTSLPGALVGGLIIGVVEGLGGYWGGEIREVIPWMIMLLILIVRPWGLLGERRIERI